MICDLGCCHICCRLFSKLKGVKFVIEDNDQLHSTELFEKGELASVIPCCLKSLFCTIDGYVPTTELLLFYDYASQ